MQMSKVPIISGYGKYLSYGNLDCYKPKGMCNWYIHANKQSIRELITVDSQKAFDVVNHIIMLDKMYETGVHPTLWTIVKDFYDGLTSKIK